MRNGIVTSNNFTLVVHHGRDCSLRFLGQTGDEALLAGAGPVQEARRSMNASALGHPRSSALAKDLVYAGIPLKQRRHHRSRVGGWLSRTPKVRQQPTVVSRDDRAVQMLDAAFRALPRESRDEVRARLMQVIVTFERNKDVAPVVDFMQSVLITARLNANPRYREAVKAAEAESWDGPGVSVEDMVRVADERRRAAQGQAL